MAGPSEGLSPHQVVVVDDLTEYGGRLCEAVTRVLGQGRGGHQDDCALMAHPAAIGTPDDYWNGCSVVLVDARDSQWRYDERTPAAAGEVLRRLKELDAPPRMVVYSANFDNPYFLRYVAEDAEAFAYYDAGVLLRDAEHLRSALLDVKPTGQVAMPTAEDTGELGSGADVVGAVTRLRCHRETWRWARGLEGFGWKDMKEYPRRVARDVATKRLRMAPAERNYKARGKDRNPDGGDITSVVRRLLGFDRPEH